MGLGLGFRAWGDGRWAYRVFFLGCFEPELFGSGFQAKSLPAGVAAPSSKTPLRQVPSGPGTDEAVILNIENSYHLLSRGGSSEANRAWSCNTPLP